MDDWRDDDLDGFECGELWMWCIEEKEEVGFVLKTDDEWNDGENAFVVANIATVMAAIENFMFDYVICVVENQ